MKFLITARVWLASFIIGNISFMKNVHINGDTYLDSKNKTAFLSYCHFNGKILCSEGEFFLIDGTFHLVKRER